MWRSLPSQENPTPPLLNQSALPSYLVTPLPRCAFLFDRHVHKTGGSTMRQIFLANDQHDAWVYWGYSMMQFMGVATRLTQLLLSNAGRKGAKGRAGPTQGTQIRSVRRRDEGGGV